MNIGQKIVEKLHLMQQMEDQISFSIRSREGSEKGYNLTEEAGDLAVSVSIPDMDKYSFVVSKIDIDNKNFTADQPIKEVLQQQARFVEKQISYLSEMLSLVELDEHTLVAQIRSTRPWSKKNKRQYFELLLQKGTRATFSRYEKKNDELERQSVPFLLTEEILPRLIDDLAAIWQK